MMMLFRQSPPVSLKRQRLSTIENHIWLALLILSFVGFYAQAQRFVEINGNIDLIYYEESDTTTQLREDHRLYALKCITGVNEWRIENNFPLNGEQMWWYDTTNIYSSTSITKDLSAQHPARPGEPSEVPFSEAKSNITVRIVPAAEGYPMGDIGVNIPWLAFCSGAYLKNHAGKLPLPTALTDFRPAAIYYTAKVDSFDDTFGLPQFVELYTAQINSNLLFRYAVDESTNYSGWNLPIKFHYTTYQRRANAVWKPFVGGIGQISSICDASHPASILNPNAQTTIVDYRFHSASKAVDALIYGATNLTLGISTNNPVLIAKYADRLKKRPYRALFTVSQYRWILVAIVCLPIIVILRNASK